MSRPEPTHRSRASRLAVATALVLWLGLGFDRANAAPTEGDVSRPDANDVLKQANHPIPTQLQLAFQPQYTFPNGESGYIAQLLFQPVMPYDGFFVPGLAVPGFRSVARIHVFAQGQ